MNFPAPARQAVLAAGLMMAWQVAGKATRDTLFLAVFPPSALPAAVGASAVLAILIAILVARLLRSCGPARVIPAAYLAGAVLHGGEYLLLARYPQVIGAFVYLHVMSLGPVLLSGFWALANERFDAREARRRFGHITAFGTLGAVAGGLLGERVSSLAVPAGLLILLAVLQLACGFSLMRFAPPRSTEFQREAQSIPDVISSAPYLLGLICFVLMTSVSAATLDYLFKFNAYGAFGKGPALGRFFSVFYAVTSAVTFAMQAAVSRMWMKRFGPGGTVAVLPITVTGASLASLLLPGATALIVARGLEQLLRGSLYRSGYELFYTPMPADEKRTTKPVIDIGVDRLGDGLAAAFISFMISFPAPVASRVILATTAVISALAAWLAFRLDRAYVDVLERGLARQAVSIAPEEAEDAVTRTVALRSTVTGSYGSTVLRGAPGAAADPVLQRLAELRSKDAVRIRAALEKPVEPVLLPQVIELLGHDDVARRVHDILVQSGPRTAGLLVDTLANPAVALKVRRRIPRILAATGGRIAWEGLLAQLGDSNFEIRYRCGRALDKIRTRHPEYRPDQNLICEIVSRELIAYGRASPPSGVGAAASGLQAGAAGPVDPAAQRLSHISNLLALVLPPQAIGLAFRALLTDDPKLRATALEYLDSVLPETLRNQIAEQFERPPQAARPAARAEVALTQLMEASPSIVAKLEETDVQEERDA